MGRGGCKTVLAIAQRISFSVALDLLQVKEPDV